ncbi:hypothetical protein N7516_001585 [Penicillium verrucosum]|uniref:uncharacterized protein n=1 Tax=Penicillium verrucosum TaxID=60171 RepID=UPI0025454D09|nr:uncharacterized protein N7516_001585 [Penicillium verrucosum]KAJ5941417.1 hypothetical protein N7516_001585 [Penicillium verrucosum]
MAAIKAIRSKDATSKIKLIRYSYTGDRLGIYLVGGCFGLLGFSYFSSYYPTPTMMIDCDLEKTWEEIVFRE